MKSIMNYLVGVSLVLLIAGCDRNSSSTNKMVFQLPPNPSVSEKSSNLSAQAEAQAYCYLVNVTGGGLTPKTKSCYPGLGTATSLLAPLSTVELEVEKGTDRRVELFAYALKTGETCSSAPEFLSLPLNRIFRVAEMKSVDMSQAETIVKLNFVFPGLHSHIGIQDQQPASCYANLPVISQPGTSQVGETMRGSRYQAVGRATSGTRNNSASGARYKVTPEVKYVRSH